MYKNNNRETHFDPLRDSLRIYAILFKRLICQFFQFILSSLSSAVIDIALFALLFHIVFPANGAHKLLASLLIARVISSFYNYFINRRYIFKSGPGVADSKSLLEYYLLCGTIFTLSYYGTHLLVEYYCRENVVTAKICVDTLLFILAFTIQKIVIFYKGKKIKNA